MIISAIFSTIGAVGNAISSAFGFASDQQKKQSGEDAQTVLDQSATIKALTAEAKAGATPTTEADVLKKLGEGSA